MKTYLLTLALCAAAVNAQDVITVEKEYNPDIAPAERGRFVPRVVISSGDTTDIPYAEFKESLYLPHVERISPSLGTLAPLDKRSQMLFEAGLGTYNQSTATLHIAPHLGAQDHLTVSAYHAGVSATRSLATPYEYPSMTHLEWNNHDFKTEGLVNYTHCFNQTELGISGDIGVHNFSYYRLDNIQPYANIQNQRHNTYGASLHLTTPLRFNYTPTTINVGYSAFRLSHNRDNKYAVEHYAFVDTDVSAAMSNDAAVGIALKADYTFYDSDRYTDYATLQSTPYYRLYMDKWILQLGGIVDYSFGLKPYFQIAPAAKAEYVLTPDIALYAEMGGGATNARLRTIAEQNPYAMLQQNDILRNPHQRLRSALGIKGNPSPSFSFDVHGGYTATKNDICFMGLDNPTNDLAYPSVGNHYTRRLYADATVELFIARNAVMTVKAQANRWAKERKEQHLAKTKYQVDWHLSLPVTSKVQLSCNYAFVQRCKVVRNNGDSYRMQPVNDLSAKLTCDILPQFEVFVEGHNLLNRSYDAYYTYRALRINALAGFRYTISN